MGREIIMTMIYIQIKLHVVCDKERPSGAEAEESVVEQRFGMHGPPRPE